MEFRLRSVIRSVLGGGVVVSLPGAMAIVSTVDSASAQATNHLPDYVGAPGVDVDSLEFCTAHFGLTKSNSSLMELVISAGEGVDEADLPAITEAAIPVITYDNGVDEPVQCIPTPAWITAEELDEFLGGPGAVSTVPDDVYLLVPGLGVGTEAWWASIPDPEPTITVEVYFASPWSALVVSGSPMIFEPIDSPVMYDWDQFTAMLPNFLPSSLIENYQASRLDCSVASPELLSTFADMTPDFLEEAVNGEWDPCFLGVNGIHWHFTLTDEGVVVEVMAPAAPETSVPLVPATGSSSGSIVAVALATLFGGTVLLRVARRPRRPASD